MPTRGERLDLLGALLAAPVEESRELLREFHPRHQWLGDPLEELSGLTLEEWQAEHTRLFVNGHPRTACPPFESAWVNGTMPGPATIEVARLYHAIGLEADGVAPDYLGTMLACAALLEEQADAYARSVKKKLWREHLECWLPRFTQVLAEESHLSLYRALAEKLAGMCGERDE